MKITQRIFGAILICSIPCVFAVAGALAKSAANASGKNEVPTAVNSTVLPPGPEGMTIADCIGILNGLNAIDAGRQVIINAGKPNEQVVSQPYEFGNGKLRLDIARNITILSAIQKDAQNVQQRIFNEIAKGEPEIKAGTSTAVEYDRQLREMTARPCNAPLAKIRDADLKLDKNEISSSALALIDKIREK